MLAALARNSLEIEQSFVHGAASNSYVLLWITYMVLLDLVLLVLDQLASHFCLIVTKINNRMNIHVKVKIFYPMILKIKRKR